MFDLGDGYMWEWGDEQQDYFRWENNRDGRPIRVWRNERAVNVNAPRTVPPSSQTHREYPNTEPRMPSTQIQSQSSGHNYPSHRAPPQSSYPGYPTSYNPYANNPPPPLYATRANNYPVRPPPHEQQLDHSRSFSSPYTPGSPSYTHAPNPLHQSHHSSTPYHGTQAPNCNLQQPHSSWSSPSHSSSPLFNTQYPRNGYSQEGLGDQLRQPVDDGGRRDEGDNDAAGGRSYH